MKKDLLDITCFITSSQWRTVTSSVSKLINFIPHFQLSDQFYLMKDSSPYIALKGKRLFNEE